TAECRHTEPYKLASLLKGDLDWIVMKALEKDRRRRYETANGIGADVLRYMHNEPVMARPPSRVYRLQKLMQRNKTVFAAGTAILLTLMTGITMSTWLFVREREARLVQTRLRQEAEQARYDAERARAIADQLRREAEAREKVTQATVLVGHGKLQEADDLLAQIPAELFSPSTEATALFRRLGQWDLLQGHWQAAASRFLVLVEVNKVDKDDQTDAATRDLLMAAPLLLEVGATNDYVQLRHSALTWFQGTSNPIAAEHLIKISMLFPLDATVTQQIQPLAELVTKSLDNNDPQVNGGPFYEAWRAMALGMWEYRRGNYPVAASRLQQSLDYADPVQSHIIITQVVQAMTDRRLGKSEKAEYELQQASATINGYFAAYQKRPTLADGRAGQLQDWVIARQLLREAESLR
ncbi:MAG TPA: serine/threonine protein kinase, partial [Verrucomicrobiae bacterium]